MLISGKVEKLSHKDAARSSFKVSPLSQEAYEKILSGEILPEGVAARKFLPQRRVIEDPIRGGTRQFHSLLPTSARLEEALSQLDMIEPSAMDCSNQIS